MMADLKVRTGRDDEIAIIADLFSRSFRTLGFLPELHTVEEDFTFWRDVVMVEQRVLVAEKTRQVIGVMAMSEGWINQLYVDPEHLGEGAGSALVRQAQREMDAIRLWCFQENHQARRFYEAHGFEIEEMTDGSGNEAKCPDIRYLWLRG